MKLKKGKRVIFQEENIPYEVKAANERFAICTRKFDKKEDEDILVSIVLSGGFWTKKTAYDHLKDETIYTIVDLEKNIRSTDNLILSPYDYSSQSDIDKVLDGLIKNEIELSKRNGILLQIKHVL